MVFFEVCKEDVDGVVVVLTIVTTRNLYAFATMDFNNPQPIGVPRLQVTRRKPLEKLRRLRQCLTCYVAKK
jgi:hypothetical protein